MKMMTWNLLAGRAVRVTREEKQKLEKMWKTITLSGSDPLLLLYMLLSQHEHDGLWLYMTTRLHLFTSKDEEVSVNLNS